MSATPIRVLVFDDSPRIRESLTLLLASAEGVTLVAACPDATEAAIQVARYQPDVVLMDIDMPGVPGTEAVRQVQQVMPGLPVIMLTVFDDDEKIFQSICNGAVGYLLKNTSPDQLLDAIRDVHAGGAPMTPAVARKVMQFFRQPISPVPDYALTAREKETLSLLVDGLSYKMIAGRLGITFETVRSHIKHIYQKLHVQTATEAVAKALREKLL
ncbi:MAG: response regulator transcription factor [Bacteroidia bacterium]|nr:response regulator transcription factor [Bacteroidia bacterium]